MPLSLELRQRCVKNGHDCMKDVTVLAWETLRKAVIGEHSLFLHYICNEKNGITFETN